MERCSPRGAPRKADGDEPVRSPKNTSTAKNSVIPGEGDSSKTCGADQQRLQIADLRFDTLSTPATFSCWKIRFKTEVCTCSQFPTGAMH